MSSRSSDPITIPLHHQQPLAYRVMMATKCANRVHVHSTSEMPNPSGFREMSDRRQPWSDRCDSIQSMRTMRSVSRPSEHGPSGMLLSECIFRAPNSTMRPIVGSEIESCLWFCCLFLSVICFLNFLHTLFHYLFYKNWPDRCGPIFHELTVMCLWFNVCNYFICSGLTL